MAGTIGFPDDPVTIVGDGPERETTVADLIETMNRRGAQVTTWPEGQRPPQSQWRWRPDGVGMPGPSQHTQAPVPRASWVASSWAPRPKIGTTYRLDLARHPEAMAVPQPGTRYEVSLLGGLEADYYTDAAGQIRFFETVPGSASVPNPVLEVLQPGSAYVVHPAEGRLVVLRTDEQARLVEVVADPLAPVGSFGAGGHPLTGLLGEWPGQVSPATLLGFLGASAVEALGRLGTWLAAAVSRGQHVWVRLQVFYDETGVVPVGVQADWSGDGQTATESFTNA
ncbi:MAG: hypothetical protein FWH11_05105 [Micrococcales bacterium]|nr:hypothetical protein [Micrococcales bacterium]